MSNRSRFFKPSWWHYHWTYRNIFRFWWEYLTTRPFPDNWNTVEDLVAYGKKHPIGAFNHETFRSYIIWRLHQHFHCTSFVETGTLYGQTTGFVRRVFRTPVFSSEINRTYHIVSRANLLWANGISLFHSNSPDFLRKVCQPEVIGANPMFYLDAHWYDYVPLPEELEIVASRCQKAMIVIDDFMNPLNAGFRYDDYESLRIDKEVIDSALRPIRDDISLYVPAYPPDQDPTGKGIGYAVVLIGQASELPAETFPFGLLGRVHEQQPAAGRMVD